jgi:putative heme iron utilization protein
MPENPIRDTTLDAIEQAKSLLQNARHTAIAVMHPETHTPYVTRIALGTTPGGVPLTLISDLSLHTKALKANPNCGLLVGEPGNKGDPLVHPRLSIQATAHFIDRNHALASGLRDHYLTAHPKSKLYIDFADFNFVTFDVESADLNGGFGQAFALTAQDLKS